MSLDRKYEAYLCDLLSLMQEALLRLFQQKAMDRNKFKHYFTHFYQKMAVLEESFQEHRLKATNTLSKLRDYCTDEPQASIQTSRQNNKIGCDKPIQPPLIRTKSNNKVNTHSRELNSIQQEEQDHTNKRRSGTAGAFRSRRNPNFNSNRPMTGFVNSKDRYQKNQTISYQKTHNINTSSSHSHQKLDVTYYQNTVDLHQNPYRRKSFYDDLQKQARQEPPFVKKNKITFRNKLNGNQQKWTQKISRLL